uniref:Uncharacterized protein n=1 Tax=Neogobius melanostomus TaxID=47308 RepID=A0A8C6TB53_9GOBI
PASKTTPEMYMSFRACPGLGIRDTPVIRTTRTSDNPPLFSMSILCRLLTQFMSCTAELNNCLSSTPRASKHSAVPAPRRHSLDTLVVVDKSPTPPNPQPRINFPGSLNHHSSTCSSSMLCWIWAGSRSKSEVSPSLLHFLCALLVITGSHIRQRAKCPWQCLWGDWMHDRIRFLMPVHPFTCSLTSLRKPQCIPWPTENSAGSSRCGGAATLIRAHFFLIFFRLLVFRIFPVITHIFCLVSLSVF